MKGTDPRPVEKKATNRRTEIADRILISHRKERVRQRDIKPILAIERRRQGFRPIISGSGAQAIVVMILMKETIRMRREEAIGRRPGSRDTEYMEMELMPQNW